MWCLSRSLLWCGAIHDRLAQSGINQEFGDAGGVGGKRGSPGAFEALAVCEHGIAGHAQGCVYEIMWLARR